MQALQRLIYGFPPPTPYKRTKPVQVLCLGMPRTGTESLSVALQTIGLETYHGWDIVFETDGSKLQHCNELVQRKYSGARDGNVSISSAEFDILLGDCEAVINTLPLLFAPELVEAYPDAKVILNLRGSRDPDLDDWYRSIDKTVVQTFDQSWLLWVMKWFSGGAFWLSGIFIGGGIPGVFRSSTGSATDGIQQNAKWIYRDHCNMVRGMVPNSKENLLEWSVEDGWEPLCKFLGKPVPDEPFPHNNTPGDLMKRKDHLVKRSSFNIMRRMLLTAGLAGITTSAAVLWWQ
ncbi:hypothetical protein N7478_008098 [Penicillium angulare]|uniref:uncharacterized protein n=1 Tax=Penicillium angulare TaxID=116970 RepID=UPI00254151E3|nr:uncharacterized protein N7478_008098 [Penicillium angulare]KAJ5272973.1 hypothetical protein N7478_008098 [Penicillium angulare]